ncbi:unnamed protein product [Adineta steineri]|uniref:Uncharacterized protein n=1 Tax=Adineta steineri TaxID=433720 RepID=A0A813VG27_9BILA|nr:unnamed protein product [Adineta steineri]CAF1549300.1 unnamed protein product [Adineta steineri]CAF1575846.1 unnamed protein product [Adineta steineri]CAF1660553.1 unnamed protein product [Adineta steineri]
MDDSIIWKCLTLKSRMSLSMDIALNAIERRNKVFSAKATVFSDEDSHSESMMEQHYAKTGVKRPNLALRMYSFSSKLGYSDIDIS